MNLLYEYEYFFRVEKDRQNLSNDAHNKKDELIEKLDNIMSLSLRGRTRKRSRGPFVNGPNESGSNASASRSNRSASASRSNRSISRSKHESI